ncbi:hypothetical protein VMCG_00809 [Cytospora schulzeri]|uniref:PHD-type domain-containing protein n=1 Tax=Cytospora schulzeri TaxID=448051 RepID=A0A423X9C1_9PEZI|nr:hypothetical protein VMCG_00809 [Valsa malicola]
MSAPPTTRASRSRYSSPAVGGAGGAAAGAGARARNSNDRGGKDRDRERDSAKARESRDASSSLDRSRQFMEAWIEPERARLASFQEDGLVRQGVLETMEPLGARPRPAVFKKLFGASSPFHREGSAAVASAGTGAGAGQDGGGASTPGARKGGAKRIVVLKRKNGKGEKVASDGINSNANGRPGLILKLNLKLNLNFNLNLLNLHHSTTFPPSYAANPFLPDPIKQSIEGPPSLPTRLPTTPSSVALYNDADDSTFFKRESSAQSAPILDMARTRAAASQQARARTGSATASASAGNGADKLATSEPAGYVPQAQHQAPRQNGPYITEAETARIVQPLQKEVVTKAIESGVNECLKHHHYDKAYAYRQIYDEYHDNPQFLLLAESIFRQTASTDAVFRWGLLIQHKIAEGQKDNTAVMYFVPEARDNKDFVPHQPQPAPYRDLITLDLSRLQDLAGDSDCKKRSHDEISDESVPESEPQPQSEPEQQQVQTKVEFEVQSETAKIDPEPVATPPRPPKRQKLQTREPSSARSTGRKTASRGMNGRENASPSRRKTRSGSVASDSSLSSARSVTPPPPPPAQEVADEDKQVQDVGDAQSSAAAGVVDGERPSSADAPNAEASAQEPEPAAQPQPMTTRPRRAPARRGRNANASQPDSNNSQQQQRNSPSTNAPAVNGTPAPPPQQRSRNPRRGAPDFTPTQKLDENDEITKRRRAAKEFTINLTNRARSQVISDVRHEPRPGEPMRDQSPQSDLSSVPEVEDLEPSPPPPPATAQSGRSARAARQNKRQHSQVDGDDDVQATPPSFPPAEPSTTVTSRAVTPIRPAKRPRTGPRLKVSPMKNKAGTAAGNPRARSDRASPTGNGLPNTQEDNDDFCSACGGNGEIVCCDGCQRAFHQLCHDPLIESNFIHDEDATWLCHDCMVKRNPDMVKEYSGPFGPLLTSLDKKHAVSFRLPKKIREYFEGVKTGVDGEYEDFVAQPKGVKKQKTVETVDFDYHQVVDKREKPIICHACQQATREDRPILPCSLCGLWWHTDCLDPPRAITPNPNLFKCPCHAEDLQKEATPLGPAHKFRKIRGAPEIQYVFGRGNVNNGWIEVEDSSEPRSYSGFRDYDSYGHTYRLPAKGVQRDFFAKARQTRQKTAAPVTQPRRVREHEAREKMKAALDLVELSKDACKRHLSGLDLSQPIHGIAQSEHTVFINNQTVVTSSIEALSAMQKAAQEMHETIQAEMKRRDASSVKSETAGSIAIPGHKRDRDPEHDQTGSSTSSYVENATKEIGSVDGANDEEGQQNGGTAKASATETSPAPTVDGDARAHDSMADNNGDSTVTDIVSNIVDTAASSIRGKEANTSTADTIADIATNVDKKIDQEPAAVESALTPVSEAPKDGEELTAPTNGINPAAPNGIETPEPETSMPDREQVVSPAEAMDMD